jgi:hypothetical protein
LTVVTDSLAYHVFGTPSASSSRKLYACHVCVGMTTATRLRMFGVARSTNGAKNEWEPARIRAK